MTPRLMILLAIAAALAGLAAWDIGQRAARPTAPAVRPTAEALAPALERPLFSPTRRPALEAEKPPQAAPAAPTFRLLGIAASDGISVAVIEVDGARVRLQRGQSVSGWRLAEIGPRRVVLVKGNDRRVVNF
jgi:hypothetical protein